MDQSAEAIERQNREGQHGENPYTKVERGVPCLHKSRETIKTRIEVEPRFPGSHESRETINQTKQTFPASSSENQNYNKGDYCKQIKRNSFELAESHRLSTVVNGEKVECQKRIKTQAKLPSKLEGYQLK